MLYSIAMQYLEDKDPMKFFKCQNPNIFSALFLVLTVCSCGKPTKPKELSSEASPAHSLSQTPSTGSQQNLSKRSDEVQKQNKPLAFDTQKQKELLEMTLKKSEYSEKSVWSYHDSQPIPWKEFKPWDFGSTKVAFSGDGVRPVGRVPAPGVHPRIFFSPEDLPAMRERIKSDRGAQEAYKNIVAYTKALKLSYDEKADYAQPDRAKGSFGIRGRFVDLHRIGGYGKREDYYAILAAGGTPKIYEKNAPTGFFKPGAAEAFRCLIEEDIAAAKVLAKATVRAIQLEQERRAKTDKPVLAGQPPNPSTSRSDACSLGYIYDFIYNWMTPEQKRWVHDELVTLSAWQDNYGSFNNAEASRSNWATFSYWVFDLMAIEGEPGFNDLKFLALYRGWRNFYTYAFFDSGAAFEAEGKLLFGMDAAVAFDRVAWKYGLEPLTHHPVPRSYYGKFSAYAMLPTRDSFAVFDILGKMGGGFTTPNDLVIAKYLYPKDATTEIVYRAMVGEDYASLPYSIHSHWHNAIDSAVFASTFNPSTTPEKLNISPSFFCGQRSLMMTRSSWDTHATFLTMHVRGASGGHPYPDRGGLMLAAQGRPWVTIPGKDAGSWACSTVSIDGAAQSSSTPGRVVDYVDSAEATLMTGDSSYCWDWVWSSASKTKLGKPITRADVKSGNVEMSPDWSLLDQCFNDFAYTKSKDFVYQEPLKYRAHWVAKDGILSPVIRQVNSPVLKSFRTAGVIRGARPYVLVVDDTQRDALPALYDWHLTLMNDVVRIEASTISAMEGDVVLMGNASLGSDGKPKTGEPALLVRVLEVKGQRQPITVGLRQKINLLTIGTIAPSPDFKILIHAFKVGEALPKTSWNSEHSTVAVSFPQQEDHLNFQLSPSGRTEVSIRRQGREIIAAKAPIIALNDPETKALKEHQATVGERYQQLLKKKFSPMALPGFVAGWTLGANVGGACPPIQGSSPIAKAVPIPQDGSLTEDESGCWSIATGKTPVLVTLPPQLIEPGPMSISVWVKTKPNPFMGALINIPDVISLYFVQGGLRYTNRSISASWSSAMLSSWTHICFTWDGSTTVGYRNGVALTSDSKAQRLGKMGSIQLGGASNYGNADVEVRDLCIYKGALGASNVEDLYLWSRNPARNPSIK